MHEVETRQVVVVDWRRWGCLENLSCTFAFYLYSVFINIWKSLATTHPSKVMRSQTAPLQNDLLFLKRCAWKFGTYVQNLIKIFLSKNSRVQVKALLTFLSYKEQFNKGSEEYSRYLKLQVQFGFLREKNGW